MRTHINVCDSLPETAGAVWLNEWNCLLACLGGHKVYYLAASVVPCGTEAVLCPSDCDLASVSVGSHMREGGARNGYSEKD